MGSQYLCKNELCAGRINGMYTVEESTCITDTATKKYMWAIPYKCNICNAVYYSCKICKNNESRDTIYYKSRLYRHNTLHIGYKIENNLKRKIDVVTNKEESYTNSPQSINPNSFDRKESYEYFSFHELKGDGATYLVGNAMCGTSNMFDFIDTDDVTLHLVIAKFVTSLSRIQRAEFAFIVKMLLNRSDTCNGSKNKKTESTMAALEVFIDTDIERRNVTQTLRQPDIKTAHNDYTSSSKSPTTSNVKMFFPTTDAAIRNRYVIGKKSIVNNLPRPKIEMFNNHSYVSVRQCIAHFLASGKMAHSISLLQPNKKRLITDSDAAVAIAKRGYAINSKVEKNDVMILLGLQWSDAFDPNTSIKSNRGAVWIKTLTFISNSFENNNLDDTFPIAIGLKSDCHDIIEQRYIKELADLGSGINNLFYCSAKKYI